MFADHPGQSNLRDWSDFVRDPSLAAEALAQVVLDRAMSFATCVRSPNTKPPPLAMKRRGSPESVSIPTPLRSYPWP